MNHNWLAGGSLETAYGCHEQGAGSDEPLSNICQCVVKHLAERGRSEPKQNAAQFVDASTMYVYISCASGPLGRECGRSIVLHAEKETRRGRFAPSIGLKVKYGTWKTQGVASSKK